jgi:hypothetical protein
MWGSSQLPPLDLSHDYTQSTLYASSRGTLKKSTRGVYDAIVSDDEFATVPADNPYDTMGGHVNYDGGGLDTFVLTPMPRP